MDNPAARLLNILEQGANQAKDKSCRVVWSELLDVDLKEEYLLLGRLGKLMALSSDIVAELQKIDGIQISKYMYWAKPLETAFLVSNLNGSWEGFIKHVNEHVFNYLTMTSDFLSHKSPQPVLPESELDKIVKGARELLDEIKDSDLPKEIKEYMVKQLQKICMAADEYKITGSTDVVDIVEATFGHAVLRNELVKVSENNPSAKKFWRYMAYAASLTAVATGVLQLAPAIDSLLPDINFESTEKIEKQIMNNEEINNSKEFA